MSNAQFFGTFIIIWAYLVGALATARVVWDTSNKRWSIVIPIAAFWFIAYPLGVTFVAYNKRVTRRGR